MTETRQLGAEVDAHPVDPDRDITGRFVGGNLAAVVSGKRSRQRLALQVDQVRELAEAVHRDRGETADDAPATVRALADAFGETVEVSA